MILFEKIRWKNFLSTGNQFTEIDLQNASTTLIVGSNGAGKSTVLDALTFALFGKPFRKINKPQLPNTQTREIVLLRLIFLLVGLTGKFVVGLNQIFLRFIGTIIFWIKHLRLKISRLGWNKMF